MLPDPLPITPFTRPVRGTIAPPGSKSITNRALLLAALCDAPVTLTGALASDDTRLMAAALRALGFAVEADEAAATLRVADQGNAFRAAGASDAPVELFVGLAGTAARFLTALCAAAPRGVYRLDGVPQMRRRPMRALIEALRALGADVRCTGDEGFFPLEIHARGLAGGAVTLDASESSQLLSALLMVAPLARADVHVTLASGVRWSYVEMTATMMRAFQPPGATTVVARTGEQTFVVRASARPFSLAGGCYAIEPDASAASYFLALPLVTGGTLTLAGARDSGAGLQGDTAFADIVRAAGATVTARDGGLEVSFTPGASGDAGGMRRGLDRDFHAISDTFLTLAAIAPLLTGPTRITGIAHTRKQETDRVAGMATELRRLGQEVAEEEDALTITPRPERLPRGDAPHEVATYHDHRFAMSFGLLGCHDLHGDGRPWLAIRDPGCCAKTFPAFFDELARLHRESHQRPLMPSSAPAASTAPCLIVAIDGGAASGKSSTARGLSAQFNLLHSDTGSYYRSVTAELLRRGVRAEDHAAVVATLPSLGLGTRVEGRSAQIELGGRTLAAEEIRSPAVNENVSHFAALPEVRQALLDYQRSQAGVARAHGFRGLVMEGRDIGSVIFPDAPVRVFLTADPDERARRRVNEGQQDDIHSRDRRDSGRKVAPLTCPAGATAIDTTHLGLDEVVARVAALVAAHLPPEDPAAPITG